MTSLLARMSSEHRTLIGSVCTAVPVCGFSGVFRSIGWAQRNAVLGECAFSVFWRALGINLRGTTTAVNRYRQRSVRIRQCCWRVLYRSYGVRVGRHGCRRRLGDKGSVMARRTLSMKDRCLFVYSCALATSLWLRPIDARALWYALSAAYLQQIRKWLMVDWNQRSVLLFNRCTGNHRKAAFHCHAWLRCRRSSRCFKWWRLWNPSKWTAL